MKQVVLFSLLFLAIAASDNCGGALVVVEPDDFVSGEDISYAIPGVRLSAINGEVSESIFVLEVAWYEMNSWQMPATGSKLFAWDKFVGGLDSSFELSPSQSGVDRGYPFRADFDAPTNFVSIMAALDVGWDTAQLNAYNSDGLLLEQVSATSHIATLTISRSTADIAYVVAGGVGGGQSVCLDRLTFDAVSPQVVPEPASVAVWSLLTIVGIALIHRRRRGS